MANQQSMLARGGTDMSGRSANEQLYPFSMHPPPPVFDHPPPCYVPTMYPMPYLPPGYQWTPNAPLYYDPSQGYFSQEKSTLNVDAPSYTSVLSSDQVDSYCHPGDTSFDKSSHGDEKENIPALMMYADKIERTGDVEGEDEPKPSKGA